MDDFNIAPENYPLKDFATKKLIEEPAFFTSTSPTPINLTAQKMKFSIRISPVNVTKSAVFCRKSLMGGFIFCAVSVKKQKICFMKSSTKKTRISDRHKFIHTFSKSTCVTKKPKFVY